MVISPGDDQRLPVGIQLHVRPIFEDGVHGDDCVDCVRISIEPRCGGDHRIGLMLRFFLDHGGDINSGDVGALRDRLCEIVEEAATALDLLNFEDEPRTAEELEEGIEKGKHAAMKTGGY